MHPGSSKSFFNFNFWYVPNHIFTFFVISGGSLCFRLLSMQTAGCHCTWCIVPCWLRTVRNLNVTFRFNINWYPQFDIAWPAARLSVTAAQCSSRHGSTICNWPRFSLGNGKKKMQEEKGCDDETCSVIGGEMFDGTPWRWRRLRDSRRWRPLRSACEGQQCLC